MITKQYFPNVTVLKLAIGEARAEARQEALRSRDTGVAISRGACIRTFDDRGNIVSGGAEPWPFTGTAAQFRELQALLNHVSRITLITIEGGFHYSTSLHAYAAGVFEPWVSEWCVTFGECRLSEPERIAQSAIQAAAALPPVEVDAPHRLVSPRPAHAGCVKPEVIATYRRQLHEGEEQLRLLQLSSLLPHFIVQYRGLPLRFTLTGSGVCEPTPSYPWNATRLSREQAKRAASRLENSGGHRAEAVPVEVAVEAGVSRLRRVIARWSPCRCPPEGMEGRPA